MKTTKNLRGEYRESCNINLSKTSFQGINALDVLRMRDESVIEFSQLLFDCVVDGSNGIYSAQVFAERYLKGHYSNILDCDTKALLSGPDHPDYIEASAALYSYESLGNRLYIGESGDYFLYDTNKVELYEALTGIAFWEEIA